MANFTFRVQARGGKFLADDIGGARIVIQDAASGEILAQGTTAGDSGGLVAPSAVTPAEVEVASKNVIAQADGSAFWWLVPGAASSSFVASIDVGLNTPRKVRVTAAGPLGGLQSTAQVQEELWLGVAEADGNTSSGGTVLVMPGLLVQPIAPLMHTAVQPGAEIPISAKVTLMCGCQVGSAGYWPSTDFSVLAYCQSPAYGPNVLQGRLLMLDTSEPTSVFNSLGTFPVPPTGEGTAYFQVDIVACQKSTGNYGTARINFYCVYPPPAA